MKLHIDMHDYTPAARAYFWSYVAVGIVALLYVAWQLVQLPLNAVAIALAAAVVAAVIGLFPVHVPGLRASVTGAEIVTVLTLLLVGVPAAVFAVYCETFMGVLLTSKRWTSRLITPAQNGTSALVCGSAFEAFRPVLGGWVSGPAGLLVAASAFGLVYYLFIMASVRALLALKNREPLRVLHWWWEGHVIALWYVSSAAVAALIYLGLQQFGWPTLLVAMPVIAMFLATYYGLQLNAETSRRKSDFLARMSHELRTPLNAIIGGSQVLRDGVVGPLNERQEQWARDIHESGEHLLMLINDILDISKIEAGRMELERRPVDVSEAVSSAMALVRDAALRKNIELSASVPEAAGTIAADARKLKQVLLNLLSNAIKFTPEGGRVVVAARRKGAILEITVEDNGLGIAREDQETIFDAFRQVGSDGANKARGTGLGLTLARDLVVLHGGTLSVDSAPGKGSVFAVRLPDPSHVA